MYLPNTELTFNWTLSFEEEYPSLSDFSVVMYNPSGNKESEININAKDYTPPTTKNAGYITYKFTPTEIGLWESVLYMRGVRISSHKLFISNNDILTKKFINSNLL